MNSWLLKNTRERISRPPAIGLSLFVIMLVGTPYSGSSVNPAGSFGPSVVEGKFPVYHWIYWLGPVLGAFLAAGFYKLVKWARYEEANPGQQEDDEPIRPSGHSMDIDPRSNKNNADIV